MPKKIEWNEDLPPCDFCGAAAVYDGKTKIGPWANMCGADLIAWGYPTSDELTNERTHRAPLQR